MHIRYANPGIERCFSDQKSMRKALPEAWVQTIRKHLTRFRAADCFGDMLDLGLGRPEILKGYKTPHGSLRISGNVRLIYQLEADFSEVRACLVVVIKGVCDYHGGKENWYIR